MAALFAYKIGFGHRREVSWEIWMVSFCMFYQLHYKRHICLKKLYIIDDIILYGYYKL